MKQRVKDGFRIILTIVIAVIAIFILYYPEKSRYEEYRNELSIKHKVVTAYVYGSNPKKNKILYRFTINGETYKGQSRYRQTQSPKPAIGDSIEVYYKEENPEVNLWSGFCE